MWSSHCKSTHGRVRELCGHLVVFGVGGVSGPVVDVAVAEPAQVEVDVVESS